MKKLFVTFVSLCMSLTAVHAADFETASEAVKNMGPGWNLGNTLDANSGSAQDLTSETYWGQPVTKPELMVMMKEAGFGAIRVPVTWYNHMDKDGKVDAAWMNRVKEVVDYVLDAGLYCIINVHHDTGDGTQWLHASTTTYNSVRARYEYLWQQIAETFKDYDQKLLFESYNEMLDDNNRWNEPASNDGYTAINNYAKSFVTTVRNTGGNNKNRNLVVNDYSASSSPAAMKALELPEESGHIVFQLHSYPNWQNESNAKKEIDNLISNIKSNMLNRAPVIIGEYATFTTWPSNIDYYDTNRKVALYAIEYMVKKTKENNIGTFYWMGLTDGGDRLRLEWSQPEIKNAILKGWYGDDYAIPADPEAPELIYQVSYNQSWQELNLYYDDGAMLSTDEYKGIRLELGETPAAGNLQVKVYGAVNGKEQYLPVTSATQTFNFAPASLSNGVKRVTLQYNKSTDYSITVKGAWLIKKDGTETETEVNPFWGCSMEAIVVTGIRSVSGSAAAGQLYNLQGQRINEPQHGIYIRNGKKYIIN